MTIKCFMPFIFSMLLICVSCIGQEIQKEPAKEESQASKTAEPHRYGGWYCPDNFGFIPVDIQELDAVPAITDRLPTQEELQANMSLINVDTEKHPDARALEMDLPRVASIYSNATGMDELVIVIQAIIVNQDTVVGYRFPNGGNGSAWLNDVSFLSEDELGGLGSQPFYYSTAVLKASKEEIWNAITKTDYFKQLGEKFDKQDFFSSTWTAESRAYLNLDNKGELAAGFVGTHFGNAYLHIDYNRDGFHYSEKMLMIENKEENTTELFFASGPFPKDFEKQKSHWGDWFEAVKKASEAN